MVEPPSRKSRRSLAFSNFEEVIGDVETLQRGGYVQLGKWNLAQMCGHLALWMSYPVVGYPRGPLPFRMLMPVLRPLVGRPMLKKVLATGVMSSGAPTLPETIPTTTDANPAIAELRTAIERFQSHPGDYLASTLFGPMTRPEMTRLQLIHCGHHLSFLIPDQP